MKILNGFSLCKMINEIEELKKQVAVAISNGW